MIDSFHRRIDYLRVSVTDHCNLRCVYCLPEFYAGQAPRPELLTDEAVVKVVSLFVELGFSKIRITGGEPLTRPGLARTIGMMSRMNGVSDMALSTNGVLLLPLIRSLAEAGLKRINISLDSLRPERFARITRLGKLETLLAGLDAALALGLSPIKINVVVARGMNEDELGDFVRLTEDKPLHVRFIELMPMGETGFFSRERWVPLDEMVEGTAPLEPLPPSEWPRGHGPARYYKRPGAKGTVGFISALSCGFCSSCNRVRLSSRGILIPCLDGADGVDLRTPLRQGVADEALKDMISRVVRNKPERHFMLERASGSAPAIGARSMCQVGG